MARKRPPPEKAPDFWINAREPSLGVGILLHRRNGVGTQLIDAIKLYAREHGCTYLVLDTRIHMRVAHRFYFRQGFSAHAVHFTQRLVGDADQTLIELS